MQQDINNMPKPHGNADPFTDFASNLHTEIDTEAAREPVPGEEGPFNRRLASAEELADVIEHAGWYQQRTLALESEKLGIDPSKDPEAFVVAHQALLDHTQKELEEMLSDGKRDLVWILAAVLGSRTMSDGSELYDLITERLKHVTQLRVEDSLAPTEHARESYASATNDYRTKIIYVSHTANLQKMKDNPNDWKRRLQEEIIDHELLHTIFARAVVRDLGGDQRVFVRNGLQMLLPTGRDGSKIKAELHATWLNEALIESYRLSVTGGMASAYVRPLLILNILNELSPGLRDDLLLAAIDPRGPSAELGRVEALLETGIENTERYLSQLDAKDVKIGGEINLDTLRDEVLGAFPPNLQAKASVAYDRIESQLLPHRARNVHPMMTKLLMEVVSRHAVFTDQG